MPLSCSCDFDFEFEPGNWYYNGLVIAKIDFEELSGKRGKRCVSCGELIKIGKLCLKHKRLRYPYTNQETRRVGYFDLDEAMENEASIQAPEHYQCEKCGEIWLNLQNVGFECLSPSENMQEAMREYIETYEPTKIEKC